MPKFKLPESIDIDGETLELKMLTAVTHNHNYPYVMIDGRPICSIEFYGTEPSSEEAIERARISIETYKKSGRKYCSIPDMSLDYDKYESLNVDKLDMSKLNVDLYNQFNVPHLVVESKDIKNYCRWAIFDIELAREITSLEKKKYALPDEYSPFG